MQANLSKICSQFVTHSFPIHPFSTPWKHQFKVFWCFQGVEKGCFGTNGLKSSIIYMNFSQQWRLSKGKRASLRKICSHCTMPSAIWVVNGLLQSICFWMFCSKHLIIFKMLHLLSCWFHCVDIITSNLDSVNFPQ